VAEAAEPEPEPAAEASDPASASIDIEANETETIVIAVSISVAVIAVALMAVLKVCDCKNGCDWTRGRDTIQIPTAVPVGANYKYKKLSRFRSNIDF